MNTPSSRPLPRVLEPGDPGWPSLLEQNVTPPVRRLWVIGRDPGSLGPCVAIVGARNCSAYGIDVARRLAADLAMDGVCIVSGLARGIDAAAHEGALSAGRTTIAVLAGGVDVPYPAASRRLYERIVRCGAVVSERPPGTKARKHLFRERNRIIAGIASAIVVVQGAIRPDGRSSGALITASRAAEFGRDVLAVPGDVGSILSTGPHQLLREGAALCARALDVFDACEGLPRPGRATEPGATDAADGASSLGRQERAVLEAVEMEPARADVVAIRTGQDIATAARMLTRLELRGLLTRSESGTYRRAR